MNRLNDNELEIIFEAIDSFWNVESEGSDEHILREALITITKIDTILEIASERWNGEE